MNPSTPPHGFLDAFWTPARYDGLMKYTTIVYESACDKLEKATLEALNDGRNVIVNLDYVPALEIEDVRRLIKLLRRSRDMGSEFALRATRPDVRKTLAVTALDRVFTVLDAA